MTKGINYGLVVGFVAIVVAGLAIGISGQTMMKLNQQVTVIPEPYDWRAVGEGTMIDWLNANFVSENEWRPHNDALSEIFEKLDEKVDGIQGKVTLLQAQGDVTTLPTPSQPTISTIDLNLKIEDNKFNAKPSGYPRDVGAILITGQTEFAEKTFLITIKAPDGNFVKDKFGQTLSDGDISEAWIPTNALIGKYTVSITIDAKTDSIEFILL